MSMNPAGKVRRELIEACMTCPLCQNLLREATAVPECLHTFCRRCVRKKLLDEDLECCPICDIDLGCAPLEKLRPDRNLEDVMVKIFPFKRRKVMGPGVVPSGTLLARRKERSLSSLVVSTPKVTLQRSQSAMIGRKTKVLARRATALRKALEKPVGPADFAVEKPFKNVENPYSDELIKFWLTELLDEKLMSLALQKTRQEGAEEALIRWALDSEILSRTPFSDHPSTQKTAVSSLPFDSTAFSPTQEFQLPSPPRDLPELALTLTTSQPTKPTSQTNTIEPSTIVRTLPSTIPDPELITLDSTPTSDPSETSQPITLTEPLAPISPPRTKLSTPPSMTPELETALSMAAEATTQDKPSSQEEPSAQGGPQTASTPAPVSLSALSKGKETATLATPAIQIPSEISTFFTNLLTAVETRSVPPPSQDFCSRFCETRTRTEAQEQIIIQALDEVKALQQQSASKVSACFAEIVKVVQDLFHNYNPPVLQDIHTSMQELAVVAYDTRAALEDIREVLGVLDSNI